MPGLASGGCGATGVAVEATMVVVAAISMVVVAVEETEEEVLV